jgi:Protein of unknown function (DUF3386)
MTSTTTARELFQAAYENRYTWDENFPGYEADVKLSQDSEVYTGCIRINPNLSVEVKGIADEQVQEGICTQLQDIITQRKRADFAQTYGTCDFTLVHQEPPDTVEILVKGDSVDSRYQIRGREISQENRTVVRTAFAIDTHETLNTGEGYIVSRYSATFRNTATNEVKSVLKFADTYERVGDYYLMNKQIVQDDIDGLSTTTEFCYSNMKLLEALPV